ncbi:flagellar hook-length control protein FliK [Jiella marina]|uniref:flagellar hook-length control protein FliK n=1 Tax=Jiella sp. LLJ827 TaxID=2917712 RepID=UPI00210177CF|nr:flagellar hook-length control protein FliK [Jiella sp. LLJ827]MCQ0988157.1 flagellar hook-length control protein FliK [Jiella sp. LLJ827]
MSELGNLVRDGKKTGEAETPSNRPVGKGEANVDTLEQAFAKPTVSNQVAKAVSNALSQMVPASDHSANAERTRLRAGGAALKTIQIQLAPETLGKVNVTLKLIDGQLAVHIEATEAEAAASLKDDTEGLKTLLKSAGFDVDEATVTLGSRDAAATKAGSGQGQTQGEATLSNQSRGEQGASSNGQSSSQGGDQRQGASRQQGRPFDGDRPAADNRPGQNREGPYVYL